VTWTDGAAVLVGHRLAYRRAGQGASRRVLYLHDAGADTLASPAFDDLVADHDVVVADLPGYGRSGPPAGMGTVRDMVVLLQGLLDDLGWSRAIVAGTSLGGWFAAELALAGPDRVSGLLLAAAAGLHTPEDYLFALFAEGRATAGTERLMEEALVQRLALSTDDVAELPPAVAAATAAPFVQTMAAAAAASWHPYTVNPRLLGRLGDVRCPTVVLWGAADALIPVSHGHAFAGAIPGARLHVVAGAGHLVALDRPDVFAAEVRGLPG
jgi:pimeloyl-ACP methyl ester carboxylesterase